MAQIYKDVFIESVAPAFAANRVSSSEIENRLEPLYTRLGLPKGRLELMTGIKERRFANLGSKPSDLSIEAAELAFKNSSIDREKIGCLIHASVCRDFLEPATATVVHQALGLASHCQVFDLSNACLGFLNGMIQVANMIELGQIEAGLIVSGEDGRALVESTIAYLNSNVELNRQDIKASFASLTIGSGGVALILSNSKLAPQGHQLLGAVTESATQFNHLCQGGSGPNQASTHHVVMNTDSETMLKAGIDLAAKCFQTAKNQFSLSPNQIDHFITHQVGIAHSKLLFQKLELDEAKDFLSFPHFGNMGSASIATTLALAAHAGKFKKKDRILMMGIGSGLVSMMLNLKW